MSEKVFRFLAKDLTSLRIRCKNRNCKAVVEVDVAELASRKDPLECPLCGSDLQAGISLAKALHGLKDANKIQVEFLLPMEGEKGDSGSEKK